MKNQGKNSSSCGCWTRTSCVMPASFLLGILKVSKSRKQISTQWCVLPISVPLGVGQAPVENSRGSYNIKNVAQKFQKWNQQWCLLMSLWDLKNASVCSMALSILPKNERNARAFRLFFGRIDDDLICFRDLVTFISVIYCVHKSTSKLQSVRLKTAFKLSK